MLRLIVSPLRVKLPSRKHGLIGSVEQSPPNLLLERTHARSDVIDLFREASQVVVLLFKHVDATIDVGEFKADACNSVLNSVRSSATSSCVAM